MVGNRRFVASTPSSCRTIAIRSSASPRSRIVNDSCNPMRAAYSRSRRAPTLWNVPAHGSAPGPRLVAAPSARCRMLPRAALHFRRRPPRKRQEQDPLRIRAVQHQMRDAVGERVGLAGAGAGNDQQRTGDRPMRSRAVLDRNPLLGIQRRQERIASTDSARIVGRRGQGRGNQVAGHRVHWKSKGASRYRTIVLGENTMAIDRLQPTRLCAYPNSPKFIVCIWHKGG